LFVFEPLRVSRAFNDALSLTEFASVSGTGASAQRHALDDRPSDYKAHLAHLMTEQRGLCAITKLPMHVDRQEALDYDMLASADRIDSNGHYEPKHVQLVCRFVNFWKCAQENGKFIELLDRVVANRLEAAE
jgi:hypothetical protein